MSAKIIPALTGIRAIAALMVLALHAEQNFPNSTTDPLRDALGKGFLGVDLFFVLSGFIITHVYLSAFAAGRMPVSLFMRRRLARIVPAHVVVLLGLIAAVGTARLLGAPFTTPQNWDFSVLPWHFLLLQAWGFTEIGWNVPSWSVSAELFAYLLFPFLATLLLRIKTATGCAALVVATLAIMFSVFALADWSLGLSWSGPAALVRVTCEFACGASLCRMTQLGATAPRHLGIGCLLGLALAIAFGAHDFVLVILLTGLIYGTAAQEASIVPLLSSAPAVWLGTVSYSLYIVHFPVLLILRRLLDPGAASFAIAVVVCIATAALLFYGIERPARAWFLLKNKPQTAA